MMPHRLIALAIVTTFSTVMRLSLVPAIDQIMPPTEGPISAQVAQNSPQSTESTSIEAIGIDDTPEAKLSSLSDLDPVQ